MRGIIADEIYAYISRGRISCLRSGRDAGKEVLERKISY